MSANEQSETVHAWKPCAWTVYAWHSDERPSNEWVSSEISLNEWTSSAQLLESSSFYASTDGRASNAWPLPERDALQGPHACWRHSADHGFRAANAPGIPGRHTSGTVCALSPAATLATDASSAVPPSASASHALASDPTISCTRLLGPSQCHLILAGPQTCVIVDHFLSYSGNPQLPIRVYVIYSHTWHMFLRTLLPLHRFVLHCLLVTYTVHADDLLVCP